MTWRERAAEIIYHATKDLPAGTPLADRQNLVDSVRPHWGGCSWPRKAWQAARRDYLVKFSYRPRTKSKTGDTATLPLFDLIDANDAGLAEIAQKTKGGRDDH